MVSLSHGVSLRMLLIVLDAVSGLTDQLGYASIHFTDYEVFKIRQSTH